MMPLKITSSAMRKILTHYRISPAFLSVLFSFGSEPHLTETGNSNITNELHRNGARGKSTYFCKREQDVQLSAPSSHRLTNAIARNLLLDPLRR